MVSNSDSSSKAKKFAQKQFENFARDKGMEMADNAIKSVSKKVQSKIFSKDFQPEIDTTPDDNFFDVNAGAVTNNKVWLAHKVYGLATDVKKFAAGEISTSIFVESMVEKVSGFVAKAVSGITVFVFDIGITLLWHLFRFPANGLEKQPELWQAKFSARFLVL